MASDNNSLQRILIVEDEENARKGYEALLKKWDCEVLGVGSSEDALAKFHEFSPNVMVADVELPGMDGLTVTRMLKSDPKTADLPVVALTANAMKGDEQEAIAAGCSGYITKPIEVASFVQRIATYLEPAAS